MNKKYLEALERLAMPDELHIKECEKLGIGLTEDYDLIKKALLELKAIKELNPSEALKDLDKLAKQIELDEDTDFWEIRNAHKTVEQALLKAQEQEKVLADVEKVKSGKTIIHIGKDLVMMNKAKYYVYLENENEPVSKRILQAKCEEQEKVLEIIFEKGIDIGWLRQCKTVEEYNYHCEAKHLTQEEFDLLKRCLK